MKSPRVYTIEGIVLKRRNSNEADKILTIYSKQYGKMRVIAKGIRRISSKRAGHLEIFTHIIVTLHQGHGLDSVTEVQSVSRGTVLLSDVVRIGYAYCLCELVDQMLPERQENGEVFVLLRDSLTAVSQRKTHDDLQQILTNFIHQLLWNLGYLAQDKTIPEDRMKPYIESITERRLLTWPLLTRLM